MAMFSAGGRTTGAGSTTLPLFSLYAGATGGVIREIGVFNTTSNAVAFTLRALTTTGTQGSTINNRAWDQNIAAAVCTCKDTHTIAPTLANGILRAASLGAAIGSGVIWTFGGRGLEIPSGTSNGIGLLVATGTGQVVDFYIDWEE